MKNYNSHKHIETLGTAWVKYLKNMYLESGISIPLPTQCDGKIYKGIKIIGKSICADIKTPDSRMLKINISLKEVENSIKNKIADIIKTYPSITLDISLGCFSESFLDLLQDDILSIFPNKPDELKISCTCGDRQICPHFALILKALEIEINKNPFLVLSLRGISREELLETAGFQNDFINKRNKNIHYKFKPIEEIIPKQPDLSDFKSFSDITFEKSDITSLFFILPNEPLFFERKDFKTKLIELYETIETESEAILVTEKLPPVRDTEFYLYYEEDSLKAFVTPENNFMYYLKSKGSRVRYSSKVLTVPVLDETGEKIILEEKDGIIVSAEIVLDYFLYYPLTESEDLSSSARFLKETAYLASALVKSLSFMPEVVNENDTNFSIRYIPLANSPDINEAVASYKSLMPSIFMFKEKGNKILSQEAYFDILSLFLTHIIHKITFLRASKFKNDSITWMFTKPNQLNSVTPEGKNIALSISYWLDNISGATKIIKPVLKINSSPNSDEFELNIDVINNKNNEIIPLSEIFSGKEKIFSLSAEQVKSDIIRRIIAASNYLPVLKDILDSKGEETALIDLKGILELISTTAIYLNALDINIVIPKELKKLMSPRILLKAKLRNPKNFDINPLFENRNDSALSFNKLLDFSYEIAIGDETISRDEFLELIKSADGIVKYKDKYILLKPEDIDLILEKLNNPEPEFSSPMELLHSAFSGFYNGIDFDADAAFKRAIDDFLKIDEITIPKTLNGVLRPYQERGFKWLYSNSARGFGSCMADDMGLGKTIQVISLILKLKEENKLNNPILVVCPTTLLGNWYKECARFAPSLKVFIYHGTERTLKFEGADVVLTTYGLLRNDVEEFKKLEWDFVIIDEAQNIKNPDAAQTIAVKSLKTNIYIAMTGTPVENRLSELWSIFDFTNKGYLGNLKKFQQNYAIPIEKYRDEDRIEKLKLATAPFTLRRLKNDKSIISDLPEKIVFDEYCYLTKEQASLYEKVLENSFKSIEEKTGIDRKGHIFKLITSLKQICNHPVQYTKLDRPKKDLSGKTEKAFSIIEQILEQGEKAIIFTQYKEMGDILVSMIKDEFSMDVPFFHGSVTRQKRDEMVDSFQNNDDIKLMIISLKAGGTGLNLTAATNVIHYDLWWNPAVEDQATDRTYRIGQTQNVIVHRLITLGTFEEKIDEMIKSKKELADLTVSTGEKLITELSNAQLREIFSLTKI